MGLITKKNNFELCSKVTASCFCRRRLPVIMVRSKMVQTLKAATTYIEQGHVRVGPQLVKDPAFLVARYAKFILKLNNIVLICFLNRLFDLINFF